MQVRQQRANAPWRQWMIGLAALALWPAAAPLAAAPPPATSSRQARVEALRAMPLAKLDEPMRARVKSVLDNTSIYRRLAVQVTDCDPNLYLFLVRHPDLVVNMWRALGISRVDVRRIDETTFRAADNDGTTGVIRYCYSSDDVHLIYGEGQYDGPMLDRPLKARCVLLLRSGYRQETNGRHYVTSRIDAFISMEQVGVELLAKTFQPLITRSADFNFRETVAFVGDVSRTAETSPQKLLRLKERLTRISPEVREEFAEQTRAVAQRAVASGAASPPAGRSLFSARPAKATSR